jgi:hypothetical protein
LRTRPRSSRCLPNRTKLWFETFKNDPAKLALAARLRRETTLPIKAIEARVHPGSSKAANANLHGHMRRSAVHDLNQPKLSI